VEIQACMRHSQSVRSTPGRSSGSSSDGAVRSARSSADRKGATTGDAGGDPSVVIDSGDLVARPAATMAAYCAAVGLSFIPRALTWEPGELPEWRQYARWHVDASASSGFERHEHVYPHTVENSPDLAQIAAYHRPFYERLYAQRLDVTPWEQIAGS
jgi:hypothetical protein